MKRKLLTLTACVISTFLFSQNILKINSARNVEYNGVRQTPDQIRNILNNNPEILKSYNTGRSLNRIGNTSLGLGIGLVIGNGIANVNNANNGNNSGGNSGLFIAGGVLAVTGIVLKVVGNNTTKKSLEKYNEIETESAKNKISLTWASNGLGIVLNF